MGLVVALVLAAGSAAQADGPARGETRSDCPERWQYVCVDGFAGDGRMIGFCACQPPADGPPAHAAPNAQP